MIKYTENLMVGGIPSASGGTAEFFSDNNINTSWYYQVSSFPQWIQYTFNNEERVNRVGLISYYYAGYESIENIRIYGSKTGAFLGEEVLLYTGKHPENTNTIHYHDFDNSVRYKSIRVMIDSVYYGNGGNDITIFEMKMFGKISVDKTLILSGNEYKTFEENSWSTISEPINAEVFLSKGMDSLSPLLDRKVTTLEPQPMEDKTSILLGSESEGKVFSKTLDLGKYMDIRNMKVEVK